MTCRVLKPCQWSPDGAALFTFRTGEVLDEKDARVANGFIEVARREGWVEVIGEAVPSPTRARTSPGKARQSPGKTRSAPKRKAGGKRTADTEA